MLQKLGIAIFQIFSFLAFTLGVFALFNALSIPGGYRLYSASAVQVTQVYSEATFQALVGVGFVLVAIFIQLALFFGYPRETPQLTKIQTDTEATRGMVSRIGGMLSKDVRN